MGTETLYRASAQAFSIHVIKSAKGGVENELQIQPRSPDRPMLGNRMPLVPRATGEHMEEFLARTLPLDPRTICREHQATGGPAP
ncbi:MAG: hypothetical protein OXD44_03230 [Gammaproteobacteria bacterium]|nr:hypothetical protein [Gammaproteobacteria bacterium]